MANEGVLVEPDGPVLRVTLSRLHTRNALLPEDHLALAEAITNADPDGSVRVIVIRGAAGTFCSGADTTHVHLDYDALSPSWRQEPSWLLAESIRETRVPLISVVEGHALGIGMAIAAGSTFGVSADTATFGLPEARYGLFPLGILPALSPVQDPKQVLRWALTGEMLSAHSALAHGVVQEVVPSSELDAKAASLVHAIIEAGPRMASIGLEWLRMQREGHGAASTVTRWASMGLVLSKDQVTFHKGDRQ